MNVLTFTIPGTPVVWKRARRCGSQYFTDPAQDAHQKAIGRTARKAGACVRHGPVAARLTFYLPFPSKVRAKAARAALEGLPADLSRKDSDNLAKCVLDALNGIAYHDDRQVCEITARKRWSATPRTEIEVSPL